MSTLRTTEGAALYQSLSLFRLLAVFNGTLRCHYISQSNWAFSLFGFPVRPLLSRTRMLFFWKGANNEKMKKKNRFAAPRKDEGKTVSSRGWRLPLLTKHSAALERVGKGAWVHYCIEPIQSNSLKYVTSFFVVFFLQ